MVEKLSNPLVLGVVFIWLFGTVLWSAISVVRHADYLAIKCGEPYGTLILTLAAISIEVMMISAAMLHGANNPTLARDMMFAVLMIALNGLVGLSLLLGGLRHHEQSYNLRGANAYLNAIMALSVLSLVSAGLHQIHVWAASYEFAGNLSRHLLSRPLRHLPAYSDHATQSRLHGDRRRCGPDPSHS